MSVRAELSAPAVRPRSATGRVALLSVLIMTYVAVALAGAKVVEPPSVESPRNWEVLREWAPAVPRAMPAELRAYFAGQGEQDACTKHIAVVGGGPVGLLTALLSRHLMPKSCVNLLEKRGVFYRNEKGEMRFNPDQARLQTVLLRIEVATMIAALPVSDRLAKEAALPRLRAECLKRVYDVDPRTYDVIKSGIDVQPRGTHTVWELLVCGINSPAVLIDPGRPAGSILPSLRGPDRPRTIIGLSIIYLQNALAAVASEAPYSIPIICDKDVISVDEVTEAPSAGYRLGVKGDARTLFAHVVFGAEGGGGKTGGGKPIGKPVLEAVLGKERPYHVSQDPQSSLNLGYTGDPEPQPMGREPAVSQVRTYLLPKDISERVAASELRTWRSLLINDKTQGLEVARRSPRTFTDSMVVAGFWTAPGDVVGPRTRRPRLRFTRAPAGTSGNMAARIFITPYPGYPAVDGLVRSRNSGPPKPVSPDTHDILYIGLSMSYATAAGNSGNPLPTDLGDQFFKDAVSAFFQNEESAPGYFSDAPATLMVGDHLVSIPASISTRATPAPWAMDGLDYIKSRRKLHSKSGAGHYPALFVVGDAALEPLFILASGMNTGSVNALIAVHEAKALLYDVPAALGTDDLHRPGIQAALVREAFKRGDTAFAILARTTMFGIHEESQQLGDRVVRTSSLGCIFAVRHGRINSMVPSNSCASPELPRSLFVSNNMRTLDLNNALLAEVANGNRRAEGETILGTVFGYKSVPVKVSSWVSKTNLPFFDSPDEPEAADSDDSDSGTSSDESGGDADQVRVALPPVDRHLG